jgi:hypothetical protein
MEHWFPLLVVLSQVVVLQFYSVTVGTRVMYQRVLNRNPTWVAEHPEFTADNPEPRLSLWVSYAMGLAIYARIFFAPDQLGIFYSPDTTLESVLIDSLITSVTLTLLHNAVYFLRFRRMIRRVPPFEVRQASLDRRALRDFVPMGWVYLAALLISAIVGVYTYALFAEVVSGELFYARVSGLFIASLIGTGVTLYALRRKPTDADELFSGRFRMWEVRGGVAVLYLLVLIGVLCILGDVFDIHPFTDLSVFIALSILIQSLAVWGCRNELSPLD